MEEIHCQNKLIIWSKEETRREGSQGNWKGAQEMSGTT
jgi:hypothetical protein